MSLKTNLSPEEWEDVLQAPFIAGFAITAADPSGLIGAVQESSGMAKTLQSAVDETAQDDLAGAILAELKSSEGRGRMREGMKALIKGRKPAEASEMAVQKLATILTSVRTKSPSDYDALASLIMAVANNVAEAAKEGGFMGFGGEPVSEAETKTLNDIEAAIASQKV